MLTYNASSQIIKKFPWLAERERDLESCLTAEAEYWINYEHSLGGKKDFHGAVDKAHDFIVEWLETADEYQVDVDDLEDLARFVVNHRMACVWAILIARNHNRTA